MKVGSLCSGYGGLDLAVEQVFHASPAWVADPARDPTVVLAERFAAPNLGDIAEVDWAAVEPVDILTAGYPCQPFSLAGQRKGKKDVRNLWPHVYGAIRSLRPGRVVLENVAGHLSLGFDRVLGDLAEAGFDAEWCVLQASQVGAPHRRARLFIVATDTDKPPGEVGRRHRAAGISPQRERPESGRDPTADAGGVRRLVCEAAHDDDGCDAQRDIVDGRGWGAYAEAVERWERILGRPAPDGLNPDNPKQLNARFVEWMMGLPDGWVTDLIPNRPALAMLGNGVVPRQAAAALTLLTPAIE